MVARRKLSAVDCGRALGWLQDGVSQREVSRRLRVSLSVIQRLLERLQATGSTEERPRSGRRRSTSLRDDRAMRLAALRDRTVTATTLRQQLRLTANVNVSRQTVRNRLHEFNLHSRRAAVRLPLTPAHRQTRRDWCRGHQRWTRQQWGHVLFTDESRFTLSNNDARVRVWRRPGDRFVDACVREHDRYGGGSVMVWGGIHLRGRTPLHLVQGNLTAVRYRDEILQPLIMPTLQAMGPGSILQDDNATPHRAHVVRDFLQQRRMDRMDWPARSPDLAPIENLWDTLCRRVIEHHPPAANLAQLFQFLQQDWNAIPQQTLMTLVLSMRRRCVECVAANGGHTHY